MIYLTIFLIITAYGSIHPHLRDLHHHSLWHLSQDRLRHQLYLQRSLNSSLLLPCLHSSQHEVSHVRLVSPHQLPIHSSHFLSTQYPLRYVLVSLLLFNIQFYNQHQLVTPHHKYLMRSHHPSNSFSIRWQTNHPANLCTFYD